MMTHHKLAEQTASDAWPEHVSRLVHAYRIGGDDFAICAVTDMHDVSSVAEREALLSRARAIAEGMGPIDPVTPGALPLQEIAQILGLSVTYWTVRAWILQGAPHEGYGSSLRCDPGALARWCAARADGIPADRFPGEVARFRTLAQRLVDHAALQAA